VIAATWAAMLIAQSGPSAEASQRWERTLALWEDLSQTPDGSLDADEHRVLDRTMGDVKLSDPKLGSATRGYIQRVFGRAVKAKLKGEPQPPRSVKEAWDAIERETAAVEAIESAENRHPWVAERFVDFLEGALSQVALKPFDHRLKELEMTREDYRRKVERLSERWKGLNAGRHQGPNTLPPTNPRSTQGLEVLGQKAGRGFPTLRMLDAVINSGDRGVAVEFVHYTPRGERKYRVSVEPGAILFGFELFSRLLSDIGEENLKNLGEQLVSRSPWFAGYGSRLELRALRGIMWSADADTRLKAAKALRTGTPEWSFHPSAGVWSPRWKGQE
jgi:hypothetical protein